MLFSLFFSTALIAATSAIPLQPSSRYFKSRATDNGSAVITAKAVYFFDNDPTGNNVYALRVQPNGTLTNGNVWSTAGYGGSVLNPGTTTPTGRDGLSSSHSILVYDNQLFVVNPGSSTISTFLIDPSDPTILTLSEAPTSSGGDFPGTMAISEDLHMLCAANDGVKAGVACFDITPAGLIQTTDLYTFNLSQSNPPTNPLGMGTPKDLGRPIFSSLSFSADNTQLLGTIINGGDFNPGYLLSYPVTNGRVSPQVTFYTPTDTAANLTAAALFVGIQIPHSNTFLGLDGRGTAFLIDDFIGDLNEQQTKSVKIPGGGATCWIEYSNATNSLFITDAEVNRFVEIDPMTAELIGSYNVTNHKPGMLDIKAAGTQVFGMNPGVGNLTASITVLDISGGSGRGRVSQDFVPRGLGVDFTGQGMAVWPAS
ncbi:hypothetical protein MMC25_006246 [Agyrium rufum]|nr:hypothetical protein [Agyrium rufum]